MVKIKKKCLQCDQICRFGNTPIVNSVTPRGGGKKVLIINPETLDPEKPSEVNEEGAAANASSST